MTNRRFYRRFIKKNVAIVSSMETDTSIGKTVRKLMESLRKTKKFQHMVSIKDKP